MTKDEFKTLIQSKTFKSTDGGFEYNFVPENTVKVFIDLMRSAQYSIENGDIENSFILNHNSLFGSEPYIMQIINEFPITLTITKQFYKEFAGTWVEQPKFP